MKKTWKKITAVLIALALAITMCLPAFAAGSSAGTPPEKPAGESSQNGAGGTPPDGQGGGAAGGQGSSGVDSYDAVNEYTEDTSIKDQTITSTGTDENAVLVSDGNTVLEGVTIDRTSADSTGGDNSSFYGVGAAVLGKGGNTYVTKSTITTDAQGAAGVFAYSDGVTYVADTIITTKQDTSGGLHAAGGGTLYAWNVTATTSGESSAAIRSDRGGGTMVINGGTYTSNGTGSPAVYCTADISVNKATLTATNSEGVCIEGLNTARLFDCDLTAASPDDSRNDCTWGVIVYQSMSGDSEEGCGTYEQIGGSLTLQNGGVFYTTNTESKFILQNVDIKTTGTPDFFLKCTGNSNERGWGTTGSNGADCSFTAIEQVMKGDVIYDSISDLDFYMTNGSSLTGAFLDDESNAGSGGDGEANLYISSNSTWIVTADSTLTNLYNEGNIVDDDGNTVTIKGTDGTVYVSGDSSYTVTVSSYSKTADFSGASEAESWSDYEVARPSQLGEAEITETTTGEEETEDTSSVSKKVVLAVALTVAVAAIVAFFVVEHNKKKNKDSKKNEPKN